MLVGITYFTYGVYDTQMRIIIVSLAFTIEAGLSALLLFRSDSATQLIQTASFLVFILACTAIAFGFVWMSSARAHLALHRQATCDPLTGLLNRRGFLAVAPSRMRAAEQEGRVVLLLYADIDGLKQVKDTLGHHAGDRLIGEAADVLREVLRACDSVTRLGGDEFCALLSVRSAADSTRILQRIEDQVQAQNARAGRDYILGISAATVAVSPQEQRPLEDLLRDADKRMYANKRRRKQLATGAVS